MVTTDDPITVFRTVFRCSNCGALVEPDIIHCESCGAKFGTIKDGIDQRMIRHPEYTQENVNIMIRMVPNNSPTYQGVGGIGEVVGNHYIQMGVELTNNKLSWRGIALAISLLATEGYAASVMIIHPYQMIDLLTSSDFVGMNERKYYTRSQSIRSPSRDGVIGTIGGIQVIVSKFMSPGKAIVFDDEHFGPYSDAKRDASVLLYGGRDNLWQI